MSKKLNLDAMSIDEIWKLHEIILQLLSVKLNSKKRELEERLERLARDHETRRRYPPVMPKYQNTDAPFETWSGRGKRPRWLSTAMAAGRTMDEFAIVSSKSKNKPGRAKILHTQHA